MKILKEELRLYVYAGSTQNQVLRTVGEKRYALFFPTMHHRVSSVSFFHVVCEAKHENIGSLILLCAWRLQKQQGNVKSDA